MMESKVPISGDLPMPCLASPSPAEPLQAMPSKPSVTRKARKEES